MKKQIFVIGDVHGEITMMKKMVEHWDPEKQELLFMGDLIDRGENPRQCLEYAQHLIEVEGAQSLMGNHEDLFLRFMKNPNGYAANYFLNGGWKTLETLLADSFIEKMSPEEMAQAVKERYPKLLTMIEEMPAYYEWHQYLFVHAGIDLSQSDWRKTDPEDFLWIREAFHRNRNRTDKTIVFGHTPTFLLHKDSQNSQIWVQDQKIGIDGGAVFGGTLHGLVFDQEGIVHHYGLRKNKRHDIITEVYL